MSHRIELIEYQPTTFASRQIPVEVGKLLLRNYNAQIEVDFPNPKTDDQWQLTAQGWVGHIPLTTDVVVTLQPKVALSNLFRMLEYAYRLESFQFLEGLIASQSLEEFYERLAHVLAKWALNVGRRGFYRAYVPVTEQSAAVRGRIDMQQAVRAPAQVKLQCHYQEHTADIEDNQILAWTLFRIARSGACSERALPTVRQAYRALQSIATVQPYSADACRGRSYTRLNKDYQPLHVLCRFFLDHSGPGHRWGNRAFMPFLVDMARLYELFVAEWLRVNLPPHLKLKAQDPIDNTDVKAFIDLVIVDLNTGLTQAVLDTKYKRTPKPAPDDIYQVVAYAKAKRCHQAVLIYPDALVQPLDTMWDDIRVRSLTFALNGDLDAAGQKFIQQLMD